MLKKELAPGIVVYRPEIKNLNNFLEIIKKSEKENTDYLNPNINEEEICSYANIKDLRWMEWYPSYFKINIYFDDLKMLQNKSKNKKSKEKKIIEDFSYITMICYQDYLNNYLNLNLLYPYVKDFEDIKKNKDYINANITIQKNEKRLVDQEGIDFPLWELKSTIKGNNDGLGLHWHLDANDANTEPGVKTLLTSNTYLNDDYDGGRILFLFGNDLDSLENYKNLKIIAYKPKAGDVVLYPANWPVAHAVSTTFKKDRYLINSILKYNYDGSMGDNLLKYIIKDKLSFLDIADLVKKENIKIVNGESFFNE
jgi:hypothetical protein